MTFQAEGLVSAQPYSEGLFLAVSGAVVLIDVSLVLFYRESSPACT